MYKIPQGYYVAEVLSSKTTYIRVGESRYKAGHQSGWEGPLRESQLDAIQDIETHRVSA